nr:hypothetical protein [Tanacetum cinerariifolium]
MTGNISYLADFKEFNGGYVAFRGGAKGGKITGNRIIRTGELDFEDVYFVKELKFNLFSVSHMCDKKNSVLFTDTECFVLSPDFKVVDEMHILLKVSRKNNMYSVDMKNIIPKKDLTCQSSMETGPSQDYILMPLWNDGSLFDSSSIDSDGDNKDNDGPFDNQEKPNAKNSTKYVNTTGLSINTASSIINTDSLTVNTGSQSNDFLGADIDMRSLDGIEVDISNISTTYHVPTTPNTRIHKDHSLDNMHVKSAFLYERIKEEVYVWQPSGFEDPDYPDKSIRWRKLFMVCIKIQEPSMKPWPSIFWKMDFTEELCTEFEELMHDKFQISSMGELTFFLGLQVQQKSDGIFISQDKYVDEILRKFKYADVKPASIPMDKEKALLKDSEGDDVDVHLYSKKDFRYLKGQSKLGLWYPRDSSFDFVAYTDSNYARASLDRKSTSGGCQFLGCRLISWQCKKQMVVATSTTKAEYMAASSCCGQVLWIQNQLLEYRLTFAEEAQQIWLSLILDKKKIKYELSMKPQGSEDFHQIVDFLNASHIRTHDNGEIKLNATVDGQVKTITEASVRRHLKLAYADGISTLPITEIFEQLALMGKTRTKTRRMDIRMPQSNVPSSVADEAITKEMHDGPERLSNFPMNHHTEKVTHLEVGRADEEASLDKEDSPKQGRVIKEIDEDDNVNLIKSSKQVEAHETVGHRIESDDTEVVDFSTASPQKDDDEINLAETLVILKRVQQKIKEIYTIGTREYWKIIKDGNITEEMFRSSNLTEDKEIALWVKLKRLFDQMKMMNYGNLSLLSWSGDCMIGVEYIIYLQEMDRISSC